MIAMFLLAIVGIGDPPEPLPIDEAMAALEAAMPRLKDVQAEAEEDIARLGPVEQGWATSGNSAATVIEAASGSAARHVLGEWEKGGHSVTVAGDHPLPLPDDWHRYTVRAYAGPIDHHAYFRISPDLVIRTFGASTRIGNATCRRTQGVELISRVPWQDLSPENMVMAFGMAKGTRDDSHTYCSIYQLLGGGRHLPLSYTPDGRRFLLTSDDPQPVVVTDRAEATARMFSPAARD